MSGRTSRAITVCSSGTYEFITGFQQDSWCSIFTFLSIFFVDRCLSFFLWPLCYLSFLELGIIITLLVCPNFSQDGGQMKALLTIRNFYLFCRFLPFRKQTSSKNKYFSRDSDMIRLLQKYQSYNWISLVHALTINISRQKNVGNSVKSAIQNNKEQCYISTENQPHPLWKLAIDFPECRGNAILSYCLLLLCVT